MSDLNDLSTNVSIHDDVTDVDVTTTTDGAKTMLDVNASIADDDSPTKYQLESDFDAVGTVLTNGVDTTIYTHSGSGVIDFIAVSGTNANFEVAILVDGTERIRITMAELAAIALSNATNVEMWAETANKNFRYHPNNTLGFITSFTVKAQGTTAQSPTVTHLILFREKTT